MSNNDFCIVHAGLFVLKICVVIRFIELEFIIGMTLWRICSEITENHRASKTSISAKGVLSPASQTGMKDVPLHF
jgi:hypothetical protein